MKRITFVSKNNAQLTEVEDRLPGKGEMRVKLAYSALSAGTERALFTGNDEGGDGFRFGFPSYSGYSGSGIITHVGEGVNSPDGANIIGRKEPCFKVGDRVMVHGANHQEFATLPVNEFVHVPDNVGLDQAAQVIIAGFSLAAVRKAKIALGESVMVAGLGLLGLFAVQYARLSGAHPVIAVDYSAERRELAKQLGADIALDPSDPEHGKRVKELTRGGANAVIEVTGNPKALKQALSCTAKFGRVLLLGCTRCMTEIDFYHDVHRPGIELIGAHSGARPELETHSGFYTEMDDCRVTLELLSSGRLDFSRMISEVHSPADAHDVYNRLTEPGFPVGVLFRWDDTIG